MTKGLPVTFKNAVVTRQGGTVTVAPRKGEALELCKA